MEENALTVLPFSTPVGLNLPPDFSIVAWAGYARAIKVWDCAGQFFLGDLMLYSQSKGSDYEQEATQVASNLRFEPKTLQNAMYMARRFPADLRRPGIDYSIYREVASLPNEEALELIEHVVKFEWSVRDLKAEIRSRKKGGVANETVVSSSDANGGGVCTAVLPELQHNARAVEVESVDVSNGDKSYPTVGQFDPPAAPRTVFEAKYGNPGKPFFEEVDLRELEEAMLRDGSPIEEHGVPSILEAERLIADLRRARAAIAAIDVEVCAIVDSPAIMGAEDIAHLTRIAEIIEEQLGTSGALEDAEANAG